MDKTVHRVLRFNGFALDLIRGCLRSGDRDIELRPKAFAVLRHLAENAGRLVPKQELYQAVWPDVVVSDDSLVQCIRELREKLGDQEHRLIKTVHRRGYLLDVPITIDVAALKVPVQAANLTNEEPNSPGRRLSPAAADSHSAGTASVLSLSSITANLSRFRGLGAPRLTTASAILAAIALVFLGLTQWLPPLSVPSAETASRATPTAGITVPLTVRQFSTAVGSDLPGLADRITDDLVNYLSRFNLLQVIAPTTAGNGDKPTVRYTVHGGVHMQDEKICLRVGLIDAASGVEVWSRHFSEDRNRWSSLQDDILRSITYSIQVEAFRRSATDLSALGQAPTVDRLLARGWHNIMANSDSALFDKARTSFKATLQLNPNSSRAQVGLALHNLIAIADLRIPREPHLTEAEGLLRRASEKGARNHMLHFGFGVLHSLQQNLPAALQAFDRSIEVNPSFPQSYARKGRVLIMMQKYPDALEAIRYALRLNGATTVRAWHLWAGWAELELGRDEEARASFQAALGALPNSPHVRASLASLHALHGEWLDAGRQVLALRERTPLLSDRQRLTELNRGRPLTSRLGQGLRLALERQPAYQ